MMNYNLIIVFIYIKNNIKEEHQQYHQNSNYQYSKMNQDNHYSEGARERSQTSSNTLRQLFSGITGPLNGDNGRSPRPLKKQYFGMG